MANTGSSRRSFYSYEYTVSSSDDEEDQDHERNDSVDMGMAGCIDHNEFNVNDENNYQHANSVYAVAASATTKATPPPPQPPPGDSSLVVVTAVFEEEQQQQQNMIPTRSIPSFEPFPDPLPPPPSPPRGTLIPDSLHGAYSHNVNSEWHNQSSFQVSGIRSDPPTMSSSRPDTLSLQRQRGSNEHGIYDETSSDLPKTEKCFRRPEWCRRRHYRRQCQKLGISHCPTWLVWAMFTLFVLGFILGFIVFGKTIWENLEGGRVAQPPLPPSNITVGVYYYPWHKDDFHRGQGYLREQLVPPQQPTLGEYDDTDSKVISQHLAWSRQANIRLWVASWWGPGSREDETLLNHILPHPDMSVPGDAQDQPSSKHWVALFYETRGRIKESEGYSTHRVTSDISYICEAGYFDHENYFRIDGRPVLFVYLTRALEEMGLLTDVIQMMRQAAKACVQDLYLVGDHVFREAPTLDNNDSDNNNIFGNKLLGENYLPQDDLMDAVTNYDVYGSMGSDGYYAGQDDVDLYYERQLDWKDWTRHHCPTCGFIPAVSPGYNDLGVRPEKQHRPLSRRLSSRKSEGSLFQAALERAVYLVDEKVQNLLMVNSFNEWHEDTQIEPAQSSISGPSKLPNQLTHGLDYVGYGELYLNLLREATKN